MEEREISIRRDGKWYFGEAEMLRRNILNILAANIQKTTDGSYCIQMGKDYSPLTVEDVPFYATGIVEEENGQIKLVFYDLQEYLLVNKIRLYLKADVPYISFKWEADTRLSRGVYWKLSDYFVFEGEDIFIVPPAAKEQKEAGKEDEQ